MERRERTPRERGAEILTAQLRSHALVVTSTSRIDIQRIEGESDSAPGSWPTEFFCCCGEAQIATCASQSHNVSFYRGTSFVWGKHQACNVGCVSERVNVGPLKGIFDLRESISLGLIQNFTIFLLSCKFVIFSI